MQRAENYENFHKHSTKSNIFTPDCIISVEDLAKRAVELGQKTLVTTEHGFGGSIFEYHSVAKKYGLKPIFGIEYYFVPDRHEKDRSNAHLMVVAKTQQGFKDMNRIMSEASKTGYYFKPRIDYELLYQLDPKDVMVTSTCIISPLGKGVLQNDKYNDYKNYEKDFVVGLHEHFGDSFYLEIHDNKHELQQIVNAEIKRLHYKYNIPLIHACDTHYIHPEDDKDRTEFLRAKEIFYPEEEGFIMDYPHIDTIRERYKEQNVFNEEEVESALINSNVVFDFEELYVDDEIKMPTIDPQLNDEEKYEKLKKIVAEKWKEERKNIPKEEHPKYIEAIKEELDIIKGTLSAHTPDYFLINYEIIKKAVEEKGGILTRTGRGSATSFIINKLLGFTGVDRVSSPIPLYPTRFMSKSRILGARSLPDM